MSRDNWQLGNILWLFMIDDICRETAEFAATDGYWLWVDAMWAYMCLNCVEIDGMR